MICPTCQGTARVPRMEPLSRYDTNPDSDYVHQVGWKDCERCKGTGELPPRKS